MMQKEWFRTCLISLKAVASFKGYCRKHTQKTLSLKYKPKYVYTYTDSETCRTIPSACVFHIAIPFIFERYKPKNPVHLLLIFVTYKATFKKHLKHFVFLDRDGWASLNLHQGILEDLTNIKQKLGISNEQKVDFLLLLDNIFAEQVNFLFSSTVKVLYAILWEKPHSRNRHQACKIPQCRSRKRGKSSEAIAQLPLNKTKCILFQVWTLISSSQ